MSNVTDCVVTTVLHDGTRRSFGLGGGLSGLYALTDHYINHPEDFKSYHVDTLYDGEKVVAQA